MIDYQEQMEIENEQRAQPNHSIATVAGVYSDGISLIFAGQAGGSQKHYPYNKNVTFSAGDKVLITRASGTYVVVCRL